MESSKTYFEVLGLGLKGQVLGLGFEASSPQKLPCVFTMFCFELCFEWLKFCKLAKFFFLDRFFWRSPEKFF